MSADEQVNQDETMYEKDQRADAIAVLIVFAMLVAFAVHYISDWTFDIGL